VRFLIEIKPMIDLNYLKAYLKPHGYQIYNDGEFPVFFKRVMHKNGHSLFAFTLVMITLDKYTVTIEGLNEILITRAVNAKAIEINNYDELDALKEIVFDDTRDSKEDFERMFNFFEQQLQQVISYPLKSDEHQKAIEMIELMVKKANQAEF
jgi:hypothetical protein